MNRGHVPALECDAQGSVSRLLARRACWLQPVAADDGALERALLHIALPDLEVPAVSQHRERDAGEAVGDRDGRHLVSALSAQFGEVWMERMGRTARVVRGLAEHRAQLGRPALGNAAYASRSPE